MARQCFSWWLCLWLCLFSVVDSYSWNNVTTSVSSTWNNYFGENTDDDAAAAADAAVEAANNNNNYNYNDDNANDANDDNDNDNDDGGDDNAAADDYAVAAAAAADDYAAADDNGDDYAAANDNGDDYNAYYADDDDNDNDNDQAADDNDQAAEEEADDWAAREAQDDDLFQWDGGKGFDEVSMMPISCVNYNNGHMIKLQFFDTQNSYQCHFGEIGTFVVSIAHYMRAYFNHQALVMGKEFSLPGDAGYLNCILLQETAYSDVQIYAKIGCMDRETFTSTKLALHLYTDNKCSIPYDDGESSRKHANKGYNIKGYTFSTRVSFRPPFYSCETCNPEQISDTFNKKAGTWYDDDYISEHGYKRGSGGEDEDSQDQQGDDNQYYQDDNADDAYLQSNDDIYNYNNANYYAGDDYFNRNLLRETAPRQLTPANGQLEAFETTFWQGVHQQQNKRTLYDNAYDYGDWNMCQRVYKYGVYCDDTCRSLDAFRTDQWSGADIILLSIMCTFLSAMMLLIVAKRLKAAQKSRQYETRGNKLPGLPPLAMLAIFCGIMVIILAMAQLKFVNETLVFAVVTCVLLFIYMLKLTLFDQRKPLLLAAPRHEDIWDNPMDERLFT